LALDVKPHDGFDSVETFISLSVKRNVIGVEQEKLAIGFEVYKMAPGKTIETNRLPRAVYENAGSYFVSD
jgi:hypothetical protein